MRRLGLFVNTALCTMIGVVAGWASIHLIATNFGRLIRTPLLSWVPNDDASQWLVGIAILFVVRAIVAAITSSASAYWFARYLPGGEKWSVSAMISAVVSTTISLIWAAYEFFI